MEVFVFTGLLVFSLCCGVRHHFTAALAIVVNKREDWYQANSLNHVLNFGPDRPKVKGSSGWAKNIHAVRRHALDNRDRGTEIEGMETDCIFCHGAIGLDGFSIEVEVCRPIDDTERDEPDAPPDLFVVCTWACLVAEAGLRTRVRYQEREIKRLRSAKGGA